MKKRFTAHVGLCLALLVSVGGSTVAQARSGARRHHATPRHHRAHHSHRRHRRASLGWIWKVKLNYHRLVSGQFAVSRGGLPVWQIPAPPVTSTTTTTTGSTTSRTTTSSTASTTTGTTTTSARTTTSSTTATSTSIPVTTRTFTTTTTTSTPSTPVPPTPSIGPSAVVTPLPAAMPLFSPTSIWNAPLSPAAPLSANSATLSAALSNEVQREVLGNFGPWINTNQFSVPVYTVGSAVPTVHVTLDNYNPQLQQDFNAVPIPAGAHPAGGGDGTLVIYQPATDTLWEFWLMQLRGDGWHATWGGKMTHVSTNPGYFTGAYGGSGTGLALLGGLMTINELESGVINHALAIGIPNTAAGAPTPPAPRSDGKTTGPTAIPEGTHFRIDPSLDLSKLHMSPFGLMIARAAQRYGLVVRETSGCVVFYGEDPITMGANPYGQIFGGQYPSTLLRGFPWDHLQVVAPTGS